MTGSEAVAALPDKVRVGVFDFAIIKPSIHVSAGLRQWGDCNTQAFQISIQADMPMAVKAADTFFHECLHAIYWAYAIHDEDKEERLVSTISTALVALHRDNPWLAGWITLAMEST